MTDQELVEEYVRTHDGPYNITVVADALGITYGAAAVCLDTIRVCSYLWITFQWDPSQTNLMKVN